jgi:hypothetical protein
LFGKIKNILIILAIIIIIAAFVGLFVLVKGLLSPEPGIVEPEKYNPVHIIAQPTEKQEKKADQVIQSDKKITIPVKTITDLDQQDKVNSVAQDGTGATIEAGKVVTTVTDQNGRVIGQIEGIPKVSVEDGNVIIETQDKFAINIDDSPLKLMISGNLTDVSGGIAFRIKKYDLKIIHPELDILLTYDPALGIGLSQKVYSGEKVSFYLGGGALYKFDPGGGRV